ncbi:MAG TPA: alpha/beta hydrolase [Acidimicrobiales bacterium]|nr:alpha/beta hydrolase [Acidimicrobiales bacterium]
MSAAPAAPVPPVPARRVASTDGVTLAVHDLGGEGPGLLFCHPTGFLGLTWAPLASRLADVAHGWAVDFRGHGDSTSPASMDFGWGGMADDVLAVVDDLDLAGGPAVGHSMGGTALLLAEQRRPGTFAALWLYEPIVMPRSAPRGPGVPNGMADTARRRRPWFADRATAYANFTSKPPLGALSAEALQAYVDHGLRDVPDDGMVALKCTPEVEARVFEGGLGQQAFARLGEVRCPVTVAVGGEDVGPALLGPPVAAALPRGRLERHEGLTHFGPMEDPARMAAAVRAALALG